MKLHQMKKFLHNEGNHQDGEKAAYWRGEDGCEWHIRGWHQKYIKNVYNSMSTKQRTWLKMSRGPEQILFQKRHTDG